MSTILVTGAAGNVGRAVVRALLRRGARIIAADYQEQRVEQLFGGAVVSARLDFCDPSTWEAALHGAEHMFLMRPPAIGRASWSRDGDHHPRDA
ncbi:MAG: SDR family NAD(P)-dependent oxidoreductase [Myxococcales bacterium]|nr:SDR family NAD(P)-dependent oxidoreductase [Myxococcales bacterium]